MISEVGEDFKGNHNDFQVIEETTSNIQKCLYVFWVLPEHFADKTLLRVLQIPLLILVYILLVLFLVSPANWCRQELVDDLQWAEIVLLQVFIQGIQVGEVQGISQDIPNLRNQQLIHLRKGLAEKQYQLYEILDDIGCISPLLLH